MNEAESGLSRANVCRIYIPNQPPLTIVKKEGVPVSESPFLARAPKFPNTARLIWRKSDSIAVSINVFICLDYLLPYSDHVLQLDPKLPPEVRKVSELDWNNEGLNLVIMDSSETDLFVGKAGLDVRRMHGPGKLVALCNAGGRRSGLGTAILAPASEDLRKYGDIAESLPSDQDAILTVDTVLTRIFVSAPRPRPEMTQPLQRPPEINRIVRLADQERINFESFERRATERGVWHPALLEVAKRQLYTDMHVVEDWKRVQDVIGGKLINFVYAASIRGEHDILIRRYASFNEQQAHTVEHLPQPFSGLTESEFWGLFKRHRSVRFITEARDIFRYRTVDIQQADWDDRKALISKVFEQATSDNDRRRLLAIITKLSKNWLDDDITLQERERVKDVFFPVREKMIPINAARASSISESYILIALFGEGDADKAILENDIIRGKLGSRREIRSIYRIRSVNLRLSQFNYMLDVVGSTSQVNELLFLLRTWTETIRLRIGTRTIDRMEFLQLKAIEAFWTDSSESILPFINEMTVREPKFRLLLDPNYMTETSSELMACADAWIQCLNKLGERSRKAAHQVSEFYVYLYLGNCYPNNQREAAITKAQLAWEALHNVALTLCRKLLSKPQEVPVKNIEARIRQKFRSKGLKDDWHQWPTDRVLWFLELAATNRNYSSLYSGNISSLQEDYINIVILKFLNEGRHSDDSATIFNIQGGNSSGNLGDITDSIRIFTEIIRMLTP